MESSSSQPVSHSPNWASSGRSQSAAPTDPLAFFDMIMSSARAMSDKGSTPSALAPLPKNTGNSAPESRSESSGEEPWRDDAPSHSAAAQTPAEMPRRAKEAESSGEADAAEEDAAAVAELSEEAASDGEETERPDEAAQATAAAAQTGEQILAAPDTLAGEVEEVKDVDEGGAVATEKKTTVRTEANAGQPIDTEAPLDTSAAAMSEGEGDSEDPQAPLEVKVEKKSSPKKNENDPTEKEEITIEDVPADHSSEATAERPEQVEESHDKSGEDVELETEPAAEASSDESSSARDVSRDRDDTSRSRHESKAETKPQVQPTADPGTSTNSAASQTSNAVAEAVAATSSAANTQPASGAAAPASGASNTAGVNNLVSLLQRGLQRGTLQKSTEPKNTPQLDPKQQIRLINRVARAVESTPAGQSIKIRLNPSELGQLKVEITIEKGNMIAKIEAENPATRQVLMQHLPQLRDRLAENNINIQQFDVDLMGQQSPEDGGATNLADQQQQQSSDLSRRSHQPSTPGALEEEGEASRGRQVNKEAERDSRNLNVTI